MHCTAVFVCILKECVCLCIFNCVCLCFKSVCVCVSLCIYNCVSMYCKSVCVFLCVLYNCVCVDVGFCVSIAGPGLQPQLRGKGNKESP